MYGREEEIYVHLSGCPDSEEVKKYESLPWYKKIFEFNPSKLYDY